MIVLLCSAWAGERSADGHENDTTDSEDREECPPRELLDPEILMPVDVAVQGIRPGLRVGYVMGAATGLGIGAAVATLLTQRRRH